MRVHIIIDGVVNNTIEAESVAVASGLFPDATCIEATEGGIGWLWDGQTLTPPPPVPEPVPTSVNMAQARQQLIRLGAYETVNNSISSMSLEAQVDWEYRTSVDRSFPLVAAMQQLLGWTDAEMDTFFTEAGKL